jgi:type III secretion protein O
MNVLTDLLRIKIFREQQAERALLKARLILKEADGALKDARSSLKKFMEESIEREKLMYSDLCSRLVFLKEIENVRLDVDLMKEKSDQLKQKVEDAETARKEAAEREDLARQVHIVAIREREKFDELNSTLLEEHERKVAQFEELRSFLSPLPHLLLLRLLTYSFSMLLTRC